MFGKICFQFSFVKKHVFSLSWWDWLILKDMQKDQVKRLFSLLTIKDSASNIPRNLEARRRLEFFTNSLFMEMPVAKPVREMLSFRSYLFSHASLLLLEGAILLVDKSSILIFFSIWKCSVFTPYYSEIVLYSIAELQKRNEDGISILFYLQKIYPGTRCLCLVFPLYFIAQLFVTWSCSVLPKLKVLVLLKEIYIYFFKKDGKSTCL